MQATEFLLDVCEISKTQVDYILPDYDKVMTYENDDVEEKFIEEFNVSKQEAHAIFVETKKFLYLAHVGHAMGQDIMITDATLIIDKMWHTFVLFTKEYNNFCQKYFGRFLHHQPNSKSISVARQKAMAEDGAHYTSSLERKLVIQLELVQCYLGDETVKKWYIDYNNIYSAACINELLRPIEDNPSDVAIDVDYVDGISLIKKVVNRDLKRLITRMACGCNGKGCGAGCSCNSGSGSTYN